MLRATHLPAAVGRRASRAVHRVGPRPAGMRFLWRIAWPDAAHRRAILASSRTRTRELASVRQHAGASELKIAPQLRAALRTRRRRPWAPWGRATFGAPAARPYPATAPGRRRGPPPATVPLAQRGRQPSATGARAETRRVEIRGLPRNSPLIVGVDRHRRGATCRLRVGQIARRRVLFISMVVHTWFLHSRRSAVQKSHPDRCHARRRGPFA